MSKICPNCGQIINDDTIKCEFCNNEINENIAENVKQDENIDILQETETQLNTLTTENTNIPILENEAIKENTYLSVDDNTNQTSLPDNQSSILTEISVTDIAEDKEEVIENNNLETVSLEVEEDVLIEKKDEIEVPVMQEHLITEINPDLLGNIYDENERINNEKIEMKRQAEEAERERKRLEEEAKKQIPMERPDLLAGRQENIEEIEKTKPKKEKKKMKKVMNFILIFLTIAVFIAIAWNFINQSKEKEESNYMRPIDVYYEGYKEGDVNKILSSYVPCTNQNDGLVDSISQLINNKNQYKEFDLNYSEKKVEVVNEDDKKSLIEYLEGMCGTTTSKITEYKHVFLEQKIKTENDKDYITTNLEFWNVKINGKWYILLIQ